MGRNLKILFICPQPLWPINTGARLRNFHLAHALCSHGEVTILQAINPADPPPPQPACSFQRVLSATRGPSYTPWNVLRGIIGPLPVTVLNYASKHIERALRETLDSTAYDVVQIESIHMAPYLATIRSKHSPAVILDWHNVESELIQQYGASSTNPAKKFVAARTAKLLYQMEQAALKSFSAHTVVSELERDKLLRRAPQAKIHVIANGVDTAAFAGGIPLQKAASSRRTLLFVGSMDYHANSEAVTWFCRRIWPQLAAEFSNLDFKIVGRNPQASVQALASSRIIVTGTVEDVRPYYYEAFAVVVPLRVGGGTRLKILEAMAAGVPVISTRLGAEGIAAKDGKEILLADTAAGMAAAIRALLGQSELAARLREAARKLVEREYDWAVLGQKLAAVYELLQS